MDDEERFNHERAIKGRKKEVSADRRPKMIGPQQNDSRTNLEYRTEKFGYGAHHLIPLIASLHSRAFHLQIVFVRNPSIRTQRDANSTSAFLPDSN